MKSTLKKLSDKYSESMQKHPALWLFGSIGVGVVVGVWNRCV